MISRYNDGKWYRGVVETVHPDKGTADVVYVDYGNGEEVSLRDIRLNVMLEDIPMQALRCKIQNIKPVGGASSWDDKAISEIGKILVEKELPCRVMAVGPALSVVLGRGNNLIAQELVDKGLAEHVESPSKIKRRNRKLVKKYGPR